MKLELIKLKFLSVLNYRDSTVTYTSDRTVSYCISEIGDPVHGDAEIRIVRFKRSVDRKEVALAVNFEAMAREIEHSFKKSTFPQVEDNIIHIECIE